MNAYIYAYIEAYIHENGTYNYRSYNENESDYPSPNKLELTFL
jgi:hypothetical protein